MNKKVIAIVDPIISSTYLANEFKKEEIELICILSSEDRLRLSKNNSLEKNLFSSIELMTSLDENGYKKIAEKLKKLEVISVLYGTEYAVELADNIKKYLFKDNCDFVHSALRNDKHILNLELKNNFFPSIKEIRISNRNLCEKKLNELKDWNSTFFVKPVNGSGSLSAKEFDSTEGILEFIQSDANRSLGPNCLFNDFLIQEKITGEEYFVDTASVEGKHRIVAVNRYKKIIYNGNPIYRHIEKVNIDSTDGILVSDFALKVLDLAKFKNGFAHTEVFLTKDGPYLIELNPRISGTAGFINKLAFETSGTNQVKEYIALLDGGIDYNKANDDHFGLLFCLQNWKKTTIETFNTDLLVNLKSYRDHVFLKEKGQEIYPPKSLLDTVAYILLVNKDYADLMKDYHQLLLFEELGILINQLDENEISLT